MRLVQPPYKVGGDNIVVGGHRYQNLDRHSAGTDSTQASLSPHLCSSIFVAFWGATKTLHGGFLRRTEREGANSQAGIVGDTEHEFLHFDTF